MHWPGMFKSRDNYVRRRKGSTRTIHGTGLPFLVRHQAFGVSAGRYGESTAPTW